MNRVRVPRQREIVDRRALSENIAGAVAKDGAEAARPAVVAVLKRALEDGRTALARRLLDTPSAGHAIAGGHAFLADQIVRLAHDYVVHDLHPAANPTTAERFAIMAVGGYGRAEMAPHSDVDIAFIVPRRRQAWCERAVEAILYLLWDLGLQVGHSTRTPAEMVALAREDLTIRTAQLEARYLWGERAVAEEAERRFQTEVVAGTRREFVAAKLAERDARHARMGDSRYVVEPNVKEGLGGLRDLQTLYWIGKYVHRVRSAAELVDVGLLRADEYRAFRRAERFLLAVRAHLHDLAGRAEDRLTFDVQTPIAERMRFAHRPGKSATERFMQFYFLQAQRVGALGGLFLADLDEQFANRPGLIARAADAFRQVDGWPLRAGKLAAPADDWFAAEPIRLMEIFAVAEANGLEIHPDTMRAIARDAKLADRLRDEPRANALFLAVLTGRNDPETVLRWMNEAGVFGRFVPDFGRVNAQMQFDMYHHYTVDEHTIRAIGLLARIERGELKDDHPRASRFIHAVASRRAAYVAVLLHDIAKGRGGDHSELGAEIALELGPRFGLDGAETELVAWLVRHHLLMSATAFKRDLADPKTIEDYVGAVQSMERLRHLAILTAVDIRAVGPGVWNDWKGQLLGQLCDAAEERLRLGHAEAGRAERIAAKREAARELAGDPGLVDRHGDALPDSYWIAEPPEIAARNLAQYERVASGEVTLDIACGVEMDRRGGTLVSVVASDHPGLFYRLAGGIHLAGANVVDARIHTSSDGVAVDNFVVADARGKPIAPDRLARLSASIEEALSGRARLVERLAARPLPHRRSKAFPVPPAVVFDNEASGHFTVVEVNARDRAALLNRLAHALFEEGAIVRSAHVTAYGERAVDTFYVTDALGDKLIDEARLERLRASLTAAASDARQAELEDA